MTERPGSGYGWAPTAGRGPEPDWAALADQHEQQARRRKQRLVIGGAVGATLLIGGVTATAVSVSGRSEPAATAAPAATAPASPSASAAPSTTAGPSSGAPKPNDPVKVISSASTDTAPLDPDALFADRTVNIGGHTWTRITTASTPQCWKATTGGLGNVLHGCQSVLRATYAYGNAAVTVGVAVFNHQAQAEAAQAAYTGQLQGLVTPGSISFCTHPACANAHNVIGRYLYLTVEGTLKPGGTAAAPAATDAAPTFAATVMDHLLARGRQHQPN